LGNALDFGDKATQKVGLLLVHHQLVGFWWRIHMLPSNVIDYITISTTGNAFDFGDLLVIDIKIVHYQILLEEFFVEHTWSLIILDYVTISTLGNASKFGDLTQADTRYNQSCSLQQGSFCRCVILTTITNTINFFTIATTGNAQDFGDLTQAILKVTEVVQIL
jgi:hypothetical protein